MACPGILNKLVQILYLRFVPGDILSCCGLSLRFKLFAEKKLSCKLKPEEEKHWTLEPIKENSCFLEQDFCTNCTICSNFSPLSLLLFFLLSISSLFPISILYFSFHLSIFLSSFHFFIIIIIFRCICHTCAFCVSMCPFLLDSDYFHLFFLYVLYMYFWYLWWRLSICLLHLV